MEEEVVQQIASLDLMAVAAPAASSGPAMFANSRQLARRMNKNMETPVTSRGFTLVETLVAIAIVTIAISGCLFTANRAIVAANIARDQLTASYLAQEGVEYVRMMRDNEYLATYSAGGDAWANFLTGSDAASITQCRATACTLDPTREMGSGSGFSLQPCSGSTCTAPLYLANGIYTERSDITGATQTPFMRTIQATNITASETSITSTVSWSFHGTTYSVTINDHLTPWQ